MRRPNATTIAVILTMVVVALLSGYAGYTVRGAPASTPISAGQFSDPAVPTPVIEPGTPTASPAQPQAVPAPSGNCTVSGQSVPQNDRPGWKLVYAENFCGNVPVGAFSGCSSDQNQANAFCDGLKQHYPYWYHNWWAYPSGWPDTAMECAQHDPKCPGGNPKIGGIYSPEKVVSVNSGMLNIHMFRATGGGANATAVVVPRACMGLRDGLYVARLRVLNQGAGQPAPDLQPIKKGFKAAIEFNQVTEDDFPETTDSDFTGGISAFTHPGPGHDFPGSSWGPNWFTATTIRQGNGVSYRLNDQSFGPVPDNGTGQPEDWLIQDESSITGAPADPGTGVDVEFDWLACYVPAALPAQFLNPLNGRRVPQCSPVNYFLSKRTL